MKDGFKLTFSLLSSRTASAKYRRAPKQNARCGGQQFGARTLSVRRASPAELKSPSESLRCRVLTHGILARREPRVRSKLFHAKGFEKCRGLVASRSRFTLDHRGQWHDDGRLVANACESTAMLVTQWLRRNHTSQVNWYWLALEGLPNCFQSHSSVTQKNLSVWVWARWITKANCQHYWRHTDLPQHQFTERFHDGICTEPKRHIE